MVALIVIDQQKGIDHPKLGNRNNPSAEKLILELLSFWRELKWPIFHAKHRSNEPNSVLWPDQAGFDFKDDFLPKNGEKVIEKTVPCAFTNNCLEQELQTIGVDKIVIVGVATNSSVEATARTAGNLGFNVFVVEDACFTFQKTDFFGNQRSAQDVHAMSLANIHGEYATVMSSTQLIKTIKI